MNIYDPFVQLGALVLLGIVLIYILLWLFFVFRAPNRNVAPGIPGISWAYLLLLFLGPLGIVILLLLIVQNDALNEQVKRGALRRCPHCAELIKGAANVCRYCGRDVLPVIKPANSK
jgi:hypothetical protein